jgi:FixJ family two-component response regulator
MHTVRSACGNITWQSANGTSDEIGILTAATAHEGHQPFAGIVKDAIGRQLSRPAGGSCSERPSWSARTATAIVFLVADDDDTRRSVQQQLTTSGFAVESCGSPDEFLALSRPAVPCCLLIDISLPGATGLDLQRQVGARVTAPIIFISGCSDVRVTVHAMKAGAVDVLAKPVNSEQLSNAVEAAIDVSRAALRREAAMQELRDCYASLTPREREVIGLVVSGLLNKQVAFELGISEITVKAHRGQVMRKMKANSLPHLVRMAARLDVVLACSAAEFL